MADEQVTNPQTPGTAVWPLPDNLGTVRDLAVYNAQTGQTAVVNHRVYDAYSNLKSETNPQTGQAAAVACLFAFTGQEQWTKPPACKTTSTAGMIHPSGHWDR